MFKHEVKYTDYNGQERTETLYFNLNEAELAKMEAKTGGLEAYLTGIMEAQDKGAIWDILEKIVLTSYGKKMPDGSFAKDEGALAKKFVETRAFPEFMVWLFGNNTQNATTFIREIIPKVKEAAPKLEVVKD